MGHGALCRAAADAGQQPRITQACASCSALVIGCGRDVGGEDRVATLVLTAASACTCPGALAALEEEARRFEDVTQRFEDDPSFAGLFDGF